MQSPSALYWRMHCSEPCFCKDTHRYVEVYPEWLQTEGLTTQKYVDWIPRPHVLPHTDNIAFIDRGIFMQGRATPHTTKIHDDFLTNVAIDVFKRPAVKCQDGNIIKIAQVGYTTCYCISYFSLNQSARNIPGEINGYTYRCSFVIDIYVWLLHY